MPSISAENLARLKARIVELEDICKCYQAMKQGVIVRIAGLEKKIRDSKVESIHAYYDGAKEAILLYAWWKNGIQYTGDGVKTLKEVLENLEKCRTSDLITGRLIGL